MKKMLIMLIATTICFTTLYAGSSWKQGYGQGDLEYYINNQGYQLYIACPTQSGSADAYSPVLLIKEDSGTSVHQFTVTVNGQTYNGPIEAGSRAGEDNFLSFLKNIKQGDAVVKFGNKRIVFPKTNVNAIVPSYGSKKFECNLLF